MLMAVFDLVRNYLHLLLVPIAFSDRYSSFILVPLGHEHDECNTTHSSHVAHMPRDRARRLTCPSDSASDRASKRPAQMRKAKAAFLCSLCSLLRHPPTLLVYSSSIALFPDCGRRKQCPALTSGRRASHSTRVARKARPATANMRQIDRHNNTENEREREQKTRRHTRACVPASALPASRIDESVVPKFRSILTKRRGRGPMGRRAGTNILPSARDDACHFLGARDGQGRAFGARSVLYWVEVRVG